MLTRVVLYNTHDSISVLDTWHFGTLLNQRGALDCTEIYWAIFSWLPKQPSTRHIEPSLQQQHARTSPTWLSQWSRIYSHPGDRTLWSETHHHHVPALQRPTWQKSQLLLLLNEFVRSAASVRSRCQLDDQNLEACCAYCYNQSWPGNDLRKDTAQSRALASAGTDWAGVAASRSSTPPCS